MDIRQLQVLRELGELGSVKAVADTMMVTPSAVSQQLALLQRSAGVPLTRKEGRNLVLTDAGQVLADAGGAVVRAMAQARAAIDTYQEAPDAAVTLSGFHSAGQALFAPLARELEGPDLPRVRFSDEDVAQQDFPALTARYDLVLAHRMEHSPPWPEDRVSVITLASEPLDVAVPRDHHLAAKETLTVEDVAGEPWVTSRPGYSPDDVLRAVAAVASRPLEIVHRVNDYTTVASLVATGSVLGLLPRFTSSPVLDQGGRTGVVLRPLGGINTRRRIDVLARPENLERRSVRAVCDALAKVMRGLGG
ncbi:LysR family transcriptional regulator [Pseudarthrobacter sp. J75]|uniref:LysR family transcriptional regulator n=1 Tax=unclassified Pseudarthrobacter TaxID=2647000 RepID=UPI002E81EAE1|nr:MULTISPECIES: LysR family transcriptional regulator [unclassified Pseudarthrobacter]MEE2521720.1 LysR family transcriptional regulator [Pseudarthrobacter sp. J47]MEE2527797.1 LysR family transcriptional regulator [Pseudarthrobacter sp. J75]MEE2569365.1 LysR family transcriptional regulator [Pseudarthrobacter sp. J64]